jgi:hypothetical protein
MHIVGTHHPHAPHHVVPLAIAGATAVVATALLAGPVQLSFGGDHDPPAAPVHHPAGGAAASTGRCQSSGHPTPGDVPAPACRLGGVDATIVHRSPQNAAPVPCFRQFRVWSGDVKRPLGCD